MLSESGHWVKFEVTRVAATLGRPHGIKYSLTLHSLDGTRLAGFDNAHAVEARSGRDAWDHRHPSATGGASPYEFHTAWQLLEDFYAEVDRILKMEN